MDWLDYREKLGIGFDDKKTTQFFLINMFNFLNELENDHKNQYDINEYSNFCLMTGTQITSHFSYDNYNTLVLNVMRNHTSSIKDFLAYYVAFMNCWENKEHRTISSEKLKTAASRMLDSAHIPFEIYIDNDCYFIFPKGAKELDDALVSEPLEWLCDYPNTRKIYVNVLKQYSEGIYIRDVADNLRKALESFLQEFLSNDKNLEKNKNAICKYLGNQNVDPGISGLFQSLINTYKNLNDRTAKHNDAVDPKILEFLLYQTGILIRMVLSVKNMENKK